MPTSDEILVTSVREAAAAGVPADQAEARVGKRATVNTRRGANDWLMLRGASIVPDDAAQGPPLRFDGARDVIYWARDIPAHNAPIVGIVWGADGAAGAFTGFVLPP